MNLASAISRKQVAKPYYVKNKKKAVLLGLAMPFILIVFVFYYIPLFGWIYAFFNYKPGIPLFMNEFVWFDNFINIFKGTSGFGRVITNTLTISGMNILFAFIPPVFAILLSEANSKTFKKSIQILTTLPHFISWIIVYSLAFAVFSSEGLINTVLKAGGYRGMTINPLGNENIVWIFQPLLVLWKNLGWSAIIYFAAIAGIDAELYDAAKVDGAGRFRTIVNITVPGIAPTFLVLLLLQVSSMLSNGFEQFFVFNNPMVANKIEVLDLYVYNTGIKLGDYSYATAVGIGKTFVSIILLTIVNTLSKLIRGNTIV